MSILVIKGFISAFMIRFENFASIDLVHICSVFDPKVITVSDEHFAIVPNLHFDLVKAAQLIVIEDSEKKVRAFDFFQTALQIPRLGCEEPKNIVML